MSSEELPLPYGWIQEFDPKTNHPFWVCDVSFPSPHHSSAHCRWTLKRIRLVRSGRIRMTMSNTSGNTQTLGRRLTALLSSKSQRTPLPPRPAATPSMAMTAPAWRTTTRLHPILPRKERGSEGSSARSRIRPSEPKKSAKRTERSRRGCVQESLSQLSF